MTLLTFCQDVADAIGIVRPPSIFGSADPTNARAGEVSGTLTAADVLAQAGNGIAAGEFAEVIALIRAGRTYVNVHSAKFPPGEIRSQIDRRDSGRDGDHGDH